MARFSAITCDHCDARDVIEHPPKNDIKSYALTIHVGTNRTADPIKKVNADLCAACYKTLEDAIFSLMTQQPKSTGF